MGFPIPQTANDRQPVAPVEPHLIDSRFNSVAEYEAFLDAFAREAKATAATAPAVPKAAAAGTGSNVISLRGFRPMETSGDALHAKIDADLARSGITSEDKRLMQIKVFSAEEAERLFGAAVARRVRAHGAYKIIYLDKDGRPNGFWRARILDGIDPKYLQQPGSGAHAYLPPLADWAAIAGDTSQMVIETEGEKKAARACKAGYNSLAFGGVDSINCPELEPDNEFLWTGRRSVIVFDEEPLGTKARLNVLAAAARLARKRRAWGANVYYITLPTGDDGKKLGLDDLLQQPGGAEKLAELLKSGLQEFTEIIAIDDFNKRNCAILAPQ